MPDDKTEYFEEYDALTSDVTESLHQQFSESIVRWLTFVELESLSAQLVAGLGKHLSRQDWQNAYATPSAGMGGGTVHLPLEKLDRLGAQLDLFRAVGRGELSATDFALGYLRSGTTNLNQMTHDVVRHQFTPMARDLRRHIGQNWDEIMSGGVPASDRIVSLDHNSQSYLELLDALKKVREAVENTNAYDDTDDKEQRLSELSAGETLLHAPRVSVAAIKATTFRCLIYLGNKFADNIVGALVTAAIGLVCAAFGFHWIG
jgi:hypothetical protein